MHSLGVCTPTHHLTTTKHTTLQRLRSQQLPRQSLSTTGTQPFARVRGESVGVATVPDPQPLLTFAAMGKKGLRLKTGVERRSSEYARVGFLVPLASRGRRSPQAGFGRHPTARVESELGECEGMTQAAGLECFVSQYWRSLLVQDRAVSFRVVCD